MVAITVTAISLGANASTQLVQFGEAIALGASVYLNISDNKWYEALNDTAAHAGGDGVGIALHAIEDDGFWGVIVTAGTVYIDGGLTEGTVLVIGDTAGDINPDVDLGSGDFKTVLGVVGDLGTGTTDSDEFTMQPLASGHQIA